ncbi:MAG: hypothetical protein GXY15_03345 [Candidatus Hydrogenedentes bacterium]|nr:hypothetical protein [Candidatus Hydrogenedentota bacterium]
MLAFIAALGIGCMVHGAAPAPGETATAAEWAAAKFAGAPAPDPGMFIEVLGNYGPVHQNTRGGKPLCLRGADGGVRRHDRGLYCHAPGALRVTLDRPAARLEAVVGVDGNDQTSGGRGSVVFAVSVGDRTVWTSGTLTEAGPAAEVSADLGGARVFTLGLGDGGDGNACDQGDWADARVVCADGSVVGLGDLPLRDRTAPGFDGAPFFSFTCGGKASADLLPSWTVTRATEAPDARRARHTATWTDPETGLEVRCDGVRYLDFPTVEWTLHFRNTGAADTPLLENVRAVDTAFRRDPHSEFLMRGIRGDNCTSASYEPLETPLPPKERVRLACTGGRPTQEVFPGFNIAWGGGGVICALGWPGQWAADFTRDDGETLRISGGQEDAHFILHPGEAVRGPLVVLQFYTGDWLRAQNVWRAWMLAHNTPAPGGRPLAPMRSLCNGNYYPGLMTVAASERAFIERHLAEQVDFTCWWQDAGWYPCDGPGWPKTGTWEVDRGRFPGGLRELSDLVHAHGKSVLVWFEPERVHAGTWLADERPEWVHGGRKGGLLDLGNPACREWLTDHVAGLMDAEGIDHYRQDFNMDPLPFWRGADTEDRRGLTEIRHVEGYLAYWDALRARRPDMFIDSCASGGRRNDLETLRRAVPLLRSDWYWSEAGQQCLSYGLSLWIPYHGTGVIYDHDAYWWRSSMAPEMSFGPAAAGVEKTDFALLRKMTAEHRRIAPYLLGDFHPLTPYTREENAWMVLQFDRPDLGGGVVRAFRRTESIYESARVPLRGLDPAAAYTVTDLDTGESQSLTGRALTEQGLPLLLPERPSARVFMYEGNKPK